MALHLEDLIIYDVFSNRPSAGQDGRVFYSSDTETIYRDNGSSWDELIIVNRGPTLYDGKSSAPGVEDDYYAGYVEGDVWVDETNDKAYICLDSTTDAAVWTEITQSGGGGGGGGGLVFLEELTASLDASLDFESTLSSTYDTYLFEIVDSLIPATDGVDLYIRCSTDGGLSYDAGNNYAFTNHVNSFSSQTPTGVAVGSPTTAFRVANAAEIGNDANWGVSGNLKFFNPNGSDYKRLRFIGDYLKNTTVHIRVDGRFAYLSTSVVDAIQFLFSNGNIASGKIRSYGVVKS